MSSNKEDEDCTEQSITLHKFIPQARFRLGDGLIMSNILYKCRNFNSKNRGVRFVRRRGDFD